MGTGSFPGIKSGRGVKLTPHPLLESWSRKRRAIPLLPLWAVRPVQSLSTCTRVHFTIFFFFLLLSLLHVYVSKYVSFQQTRHCKQDRAVLASGIMSQGECDRRGRTFCLMNAINEPRDWVMTPRRKHWFVNWPSDRPPVVEWYWLLLRRKRVMTKDGPSHLSESAHRSAPK